MVGARLRYFQCIVEGPSSGALMIWARFQHSRSQFRVTVPRSELLGDGNGFISSSVRDPTPNRRRGGGDLGGLRSGTTPEAAGLAQSLLAPDRVSRWKCCDCPDPPIVCCDSETRQKCFCWRGKGSPRRLAAIQIE
eukprot:gene8218-biopygen3051